MENIPDAALSSEEMPWLIFRLKEQLFSINVQNVNTIVRMPHTINEVPDSPPYIRGILNLRGEIVPVAEMRKLLHMPLMQDEYKEFVAMLEQRKTDHINWVHELERCIQTGDNFRLATDPHQCAFGRWYDDFRTSNHSVQFHMNKIDQPHKDLHHTALQAFACNQQHDHCKREVCLKEAVDRAAREYMPKVVSLLEEAKDIFRTSYREMCIVLAKDSKRLGLAVDEVDAVSQLHFINEEKEGEKSSALSHSDLVYGVAQSDAAEGMILVLNESRLFSLMQRSPDCNAI